MTGARISALFRQGLYRARKKINRYFHSSRLPRTFNEPTPPSLPPGGRVFGKRQGNRIFTERRVTAQLDSILVRRRVQLDCVRSFLRFHKLINWRACMHGLPSPIRVNLDRSIGERVTRNGSVYGFIKILQFLPSLFPTVVIIRSKNFIFHARGYRRKTGT